MPTGGGKSLCFQLASLIENKTIIVISFLLSLTDDQIYNAILKFIEDNKNISICRYDSTINICGRQNILNNIRNGKVYNLIYVTPEMFIEKSFESVLDVLKTKNMLSRFVIDEVHLLKDWKSFRGTVLKIGDVKRNPKYSSIPFVTFTATATTETKNFVLNNLGINNSKTCCITLPFNRPNITPIFKCVGREDAMIDMVLFIKEFFQQHGRYPKCIAYCATHSNCESAVKKFSSLCPAMGAKYYHAGLSPEKRKEIYLSWNKNNTAKKPLKGFAEENQKQRIVLNQGILTMECDIIFCTIAFGVGIDCPVDVVFIIDVPDKLNALLQMLGRAGRDGKQAFCFVYYNFFKFKNNNFFKKGTVEVDEEEKSKVSFVCRMNFTGKERYPCEITLKEGEVIPCRKTLLSMYFSPKEAADLRCSDKNNVKFKKCDLCLKREMEIQKKIEKEKKKLNKKKF